MKKILEFPEKTRVFKGSEVTQAVTIFIYKKDLIDDYTFIVKTKISNEELNRLDNLDRFIFIKKTKLAKLTSSEYVIPLITSKVEWDILEYLSFFQKVKNKIFLFKQGDINETKDKEFISNDLDDSKIILVKGIHFDRFFVNLDPEGPKPRWIRDYHKLLLKHPKVADWINTERIGWREVVNKALKPRLRFALIPKNCVVTHTINFAVVQSDRTKLNAFYILSILNSTLIDYVFQKFSASNHVTIPEIKRLPFLLANEGLQDPFIILAKYMLFLKQYQTYFASDDSRLKYIIDYFDNLIDCLVYELYLDDVVKIPIQQFIENKLVDIDIHENLLEVPEKEREELLETIEEVFEKLENDIKLNENLYLIKLHPWIKAIYESLGR